MLKIGPKYWWKKSLNSMNTVTWNEMVVDHLELKKILLKSTAKRPNRVSNQSTKEWTKGRTCMRYATICLGVSNTYTHKEILPHTYIHMLMHMQRQHTYTHEHIFIYENVHSEIYLTCWFWSWIFMFNVIDKWLILKIYRISSFLYLWSGA